MLLKPVREVAPLAGSVDRNKSKEPVGRPAFVAPLAGSVDRNKIVTFYFTPCGPVAPLAGSVDRNAEQAERTNIEPAVAPLAGSVDRNLGNMVQAATANRRSPRGERG